MAKKQNENNITNQDKYKKVMFDENIIMHTYEKEKDTETEKSIKKSKKEKTINVNLYHKTLGNPSEDTTRLAAKFYNLKLTRDWKVCTECALAKRMQRRLARESE